MHEYIVRKDGYVYHVIEHDVYGNHKTVTNLGKDPDDPRWNNELEKPKKTTKKEDDK